MIEKGNKISFHRAFSHQAKSCAMELNITDLGAKRLMSEQFEAVKGEKLYDWGKDHETRFYKRQIEAEKQERKEQRRPEENSRVFEKLTIEHVGMIGCVGVEMTTK